MSPQAMLPTLQSSSLFTNTPPLQSYTTQHPILPTPAPKAAGTFRILSQNADTLPNTPILLQSTLTVALLNETNLNSMRSDTWDCVKSSMLACWPFTQIQMACVPDKCRSKHQPGGICSSIHGRYVGNIKSSNSEQWGRWTWNEMFRPATLTS